VPALGCHPRKPVSRDGNGTIRQYVQPPNTSDFPPCALSVFIAPHSKMKSWKLYPAGSGMPSLRQSCWELSRLLSSPMRPRACVWILRRRCATATAHTRRERNIAQRCVSCRDTKISGGRPLAARGTRPRLNRLLRLRSRVPERQTAPSRPVSRYSRKPLSLQVFPSFLCLHAECALECFSGDRRRPGVSA
jgi:hypothetical protein